MAQLVELTGEKRKFPLTNAIVIGRDPHCGAQLADARVSRRHAEVARLPDGRYRLVDLGSTQGTFVAGRRVREIVLCHGDELQVGGIALRFEDAGSRSKSIEHILLSPDEDSMIQQRVAVDESHEFVAAGGLSGEEHLRRDYERLRAAFEVHEATAEQEHGDEIARSVLALTLRVLAADRAALVLYDEATGQFGQRLARTRAGLRDPFSVPELVLREVCRQSVGVLRADATGQDTLSESLAPTGARSVLCVPLTAQGRCLGALYADSVSAELAFSPQDLEVAVVIGRQGALAIHHAELRRQLRMQNAMEDRLELVERLAGGIAHRFNNSLSVILSTMELIAPELGGRCLQELGDIRGAVDQASDLTHELLALGRRGPLRVASFAFDELVQEVMQVAPSASGHARVRLTLGASGGFVRIDRALAQQALVSLLRFAARNVALGGHIELRTVLEQPRPPARGEGDTEPPELPPVVVLRVIDDGPTLSGPQAARVFDPFPEGPLVSASSGLGLASAASVARQAGGSLALERLPVGNAFVLTLPCVAAPAAREPTPVRQVKAGMGQSLLLIDDEEVVLRVTARALARLGFIVHTAPSGPEALAFFEARGAEIDCVICDVLMPGMNGPEVVSALRAMRPALPVLFVSGYADAALETQVFDARTTHFLAKPFAPSEVIERLLLLLPDVRVRPV